MKKNSLFLATVLSVSLLTAQNKVPASSTLDIDLNSQGASVPSSMYGIFFEEINHAGDGGLYAEMLMNRSFEERVLPKGGYTVENGALIPPPVSNHQNGHIAKGRYKWGTDPYPGWAIEKKGTAKASVYLTTDSPANSTAPTNMVLDIENPGDGISLVNKGYWGIPLKKGGKYKLRLITRTPSDYRGTLTVRLVGAGGKELARTRISTTNDGKWHGYKKTLTASDTSSVAKLYLDMNAPGKISFDYVSLFPKKTFKDRENGMREDIAGMIEAMKPAFIRWPGGCIVEGITLSNRVEWKKTMGDPATRQGEYDTWGYHNTYGFGYKEFLEFCEDVGAQGMFVCNVGMGCQARTGDACNDEEAQPLIQDVLDAIEYAIGNEYTKWGARRAAEGHPAPYPLQYVEIGNENWGDLYNRRFDMFYKAIKEKYPQLTLISNHGLGDGVKGVEKTDMIDPHWYVNPDFFFRNANLFDTYPREGYTVYVGEYACNRGVGGGNMLAALSEAAFISGMERNSDLVTMASYAPLFENRHDREWPTNLIWFDNDEVVGRSSYYVQKMFAENRPTYNLSTQLNIQSDTVYPVITGKGYVGFGTWSTQADYKDLKITTPDGKAYTPDFSNPSEWNVVKGSWNEKNGIYSQTSDENLTSVIWNKERFDECVIELKARKIGGKEGFFIYFDLEKPNLEKGLSANIGGWGNTATRFEGIQEGTANSLSRSVSQRIETGKWYDIKIKVSRTEAQYYLDGQLALTYKPEPLPRDFALSGYEEDSKEVIVKYINAKEHPTRIKINLKGGEVKPEGEIITLSAESLTEENSFEQPQKITPKQTKYNGFSSQFEYEFAPNSFTIFRMKKK